MREGRGMMMDEFRSYEPVSFTRYGCRITARDAAGNAVLYVDLVRPGPHMEAGMIGIPRDMRKAVAAMLREAAIDRGKVYERMFFVEGDGTSVSIQKMNRGATVYECATMSAYDALRLAGWLKQGGAA